MIKNNNIRPFYYQFIMRYHYCYLIKLQFLGFRFHGWQKQPDVKTIHWAIDKTLKFVFPEIRKKTVGVGRTDAKVSSSDFYVQLFIDVQIDTPAFIHKFNQNSPADIKVISIEKLEDHSFNIIQCSKVKEYRYYFSFGEKNHPYSAPFMTGIQTDLDIKRMQRGAKLFIGFHNFKRYCTKPSKETKVYREILDCRIEINTYLTASFFPKISYVLIIKGQGFLRNQVRLIMGALFLLGAGEYTMEFIEQSLDPKSEISFIKNIAPASGLHLHNIDLL